MFGAVHVPRGLIEFQADPASPSHNAELAGGKKLVLYCASGTDPLLLLSLLWKWASRMFLTFQGGLLRSKWQAHRLRRCPDRESRSAKGCLLDLSEKGALQ